MPRGPLRLQIVGMDRLARKLRTLPDALERKHLEAVTKRAARVAQGSVIAVAPVDQGTLQSSVTVTKAGRQRGTFIGHNVRVSGRRLGGSFNYSVVLEHGWIHNVEGEPFFVEGIDRAAGTVQAILVRGWERAIRELNR